MVAPSMLVDEMGRLDTRPFASRIRTLFAPCRKFAISGKSHLRGTIRSANVPPCISAGFARR